MTKLSLLTATAAALILLPGLAFTESAEAQRRHDGNDSGRGSQSEDRGGSRGDSDRGGGRDRGQRQSSPPPQRQSPPPQASGNSRGQQYVAPPAQRNSRGDARPSSDSGRGATRGDQWQNRGQGRGAPGADRTDPRSGRGAPVMNPVDPRRQPADVRGGGRGSGGYQPVPVTDRDNRGPRTGSDRPGSRPAPMGGHDGRGPRTGSTRPDSHPGRGDVYNPRGPRTGSTRPDSRPGRGGYTSPGHRPGSRPSSHRPDPRRYEYAQRRHAFYRSDHRNSIRWVHHMNVGWNSSPYYGHYGPSTRWRYNSRYYTAGYNNRQFGYYDQACRYDRNGNGTAVGAVLGAIIGGAAANGDNVGTGILLGAGFGALLGSAVSQLDDCDKVQYQYAMNYAFENGQPYYWGNPYSGVRGSIVIRESYAYGNTECRWGDAEIYMPDGTYNYDQVRMCRDAYGDWEVARQQ